MKFALLIQSGPSQQRASGPRLATAIGASNHELLGAFFQADGVEWARVKGAHGGPATDNWPATSECPFLVCSASAAARDLGPDTLEAGFELTGLGRWVELLDQADRCIQIKRWGQCE